MLWAWLIKICLRSRVRADLDLIINEFKQIGLIRCLVLNVVNLKFSDISRTLCSIPPHVIAYITISAYHLCCYPATKHRCCPKRHVNVKHFPDNISRHTSLTFDHFHGISLTAVKIPDISDFSSQVVILITKYK